MVSVSTSNEAANTTPLLPEIRPEVSGGERQLYSDSATAVLVLSTVVAVSSSYVFGSAVGFSSPALTGIVNDLRLTVAETMGFAELFNRNYSMSNSASSLFFIPESPRWLAKIGRWDGSEASLVRLRGKNAIIFNEAAEIKDHSRTLEQLKGSRMMDLFQRKYAELGL